MNRSIKASARMQMANQKKKNYTPRKSHQIFKFQTKYRSLYFDNFGFKKNKFAKKEDLHPLSLTPEFTF